MDRLTLSVGAPAMSLLPWILAIALIGLSGLWFQQHQSRLLNLVMQIPQALQLPHLDSAVIGDRKAAVTSRTRSFPDKQTTLLSRELIMNPGPWLTVLIAGDTFPPDVNGAAVFTLQLAAGLARHGHEVHVVVPSIDGLPGIFQEWHCGARITIHRLRSVRWGFLTSLRCAVPWEVRQNVSRIIDSVNPNIVHIQSFFQIGRGIAREAHLRSIPIVATNHFLPENARDCTWFGRGIIQLGIDFLLADAARTYQLVDSITAPTRSAATHLEKTMHLVESTVKDISCGIHIGDYTEKTCRPHLNEILYVGRLAPEKQLTTLLKAFCLLPSQMEPKLRIIGNGMMLAELKDWARRLGISDRVAFAGHVPDAEKHAALAEATVFVMPSTAELQSISCLEAIASGLPLVVANSMALPHLIDRNGYLFESGNEVDLSRRIIDVLTAKEQDYVRMCLRSREMAREHDIYKTFQAYEKEYHRLLSWLK